MACRSAGAQCLLMRRKLAFWLAGLAEERLHLEERPTVLPVAQFLDHALQVVVAVFAEVC